MIINLFSLILDYIQNQITKINENFHDTQEEISYMVGNATEKSLEYAQKIDQMSRGAVAIESGRALGSTAYQAAEDIARNDKVCAGACLVASACEVVAGGSALIKYPGAMKVYFVAKTISVGCIRFRNLCRNTKGEISLC
jgi:hypothetical protein